MSRNSILLIFVLLAVIKVFETILPERSKTKGEVRLKWLFTCLLITGIMIYLFALFEFLYSGRLANLTLVAAGLVLVAVRIALKTWVVKTLGKYWSIQIEIRKDQELVVSGPFRFMRHPAYFCTIIESFAVILIMNSLYSVLLFWLVFFPLLLVKIHYEEKELIGKFGDRYLDYKRKVFSLLPVKAYEDNGL